MSTAPETPAPLGSSSTGGPNISPLAKYKLVFLGDQGVGKTSIITRFMYDSFDKNYQATIGIDFLSKTMYLEDRTVRLQLWDTAGQERFRAITNTYYRGAHAFMLVYDVTDHSTLTSATDMWMAEIRKYGRSTSPVLLVGNKWDMDRDGSVIEAAQSYAAEHGLSHLVVSAKTGERVMDAFVGVSRLLALHAEPRLGGVTGDAAGVRAQGGRLVPEGKSVSSVFDCCKTS